MSYSYERRFFSYLENLRTYMVTRPLTLGGIAGAGGGAGGPPGGFIGYLPQTRVTYDTTEAATLSTPLSGYSLVDNLNHIRARLGVVEASGIGGASNYLAALDDVNIAGPGDGQVLNYDNNSELWVNSDLATMVDDYVVLNDIGDVSIMSPADGQILTYNNGTWENSNPVGHTIQDEGTSRTNRSKLNFIGSGVSVSDDSVNDRTNVTITVSGALNMGWQTLNNTPTIDWNLSLGNAEVTLSGVHTMAFPTNLTSGNMNFLKIMTTSGVSLDWASGYKFPAGIAPTITVTPTGIDLVQFFNDGTYMYGNALSDYREIIGVSLEVGLTSEDTVNNGDTISWNHTINPGTHRALIVLVGSRQPTSVTGITYAGVSMTKVGAVDAGTGNYPRSEIWRLLNPTVGTDSVVVTLAGNEYAQAFGIDFTGVNQSTPCGTFASNIGSTTTANCSVTGQVGDISVGILTRWGGTITVGAGQTLINDASSDGNWKSISSRVAWANPTSMTYDMGDSNDWALAAVTIKKG